MPPWVARQWHITRCSRSVSAHLHRSRGPTNLRFYVQRFSQDGEKLQLTTTNSAIIIPSSVGNTRPEDLIAHITPVEKHRLKQDRFAVFFVTPSFATWLLDDKFFLQKALHQAYAHLFGLHAPRDVQVHALCAVVDRLPVPRPIVNGEHTAQEVLKREHQPPVQETGHEGISFATLRFSDSIPVSSAVAQDKAAISFVTSADANEDGADVSHFLRLPLANTVFQTGSPTTMTYSTWEKGKGNELALTSKREVSQHGIMVHQDASSEENTAALSVPLIPLSMPRQVEASMGNILRRVKGPDGTSITASQELENIVPRFFNARGEPSQATTVWALVMDSQNLAEVETSTSRLLEKPQLDTDTGAAENHVWEKLWKQDPPSWNNVVSSALASGARLHRVLSGGGGWGKKAGLLSLDPLPTVEADSSNDPSPFDMSFEPRDLSSALQQVARDGDYVQFFISPSTKSNQGSALETTKEASQLWGLELGTIPSTSDSMPEVPERAESSHPNEIFVFRHSFGALTERGIVISHNFKLKSKDSFLLIGGSTIDVPFSRFSAMSWIARAEGKDKEEDSMKNCLEPNPVRYHRIFVGRLNGEGSSPFLGLRSRDEEADKSQDGLPPSFSTEEIRPSINEKDRPTDVAATMKPITKFLAEHFTTHDSTPSRFVTAVTDPLFDETDPPLESFNENFPDAQNGRRPQFSPEAIDPSVNETGPDLPTDEIVAQERITNVLLLNKKNTVVRYYNSDLDELAYCTDNLRRIDRKVSRYTRESRELMHTIRKQNNMSMDLGVRRTSKKFHPQDLVPQMEKQLYDSLRTILRLADELFNLTRLTDITHTASTLHRIATPALIAAHLARKTDASASTIYRLHIRLRQRLAATLLSLSRPSRKHKAQSQIARLTKHLLDLRGFNRNFYTGRMGMGEVARMLSAEEKRAPAVERLVLDGRRGGRGAGFKVRQGVWGKGVIRGVDGEGRVRRVEGAVGRKEVRVRRVEGEVRRVDGDGDGEKARVRKDGLEDLVGEWLGG